MKPFFSLFLTLCVLSLNAQNSSNELLKQQLINDWERAKAYTQEYLDAMPAGKYSFRAHDSIRSFAQQMLHLSHCGNGILWNGLSKQSHSKYVH